MTIFLTSSEQDHVMGGDSSSSAYARFVNTAFVVFPSSLSIFLSVWLTILFNQSDGNGI
jgi:hypothetical protein